MDSSVRTESAGPLVHKSPRQALEAVQAAPATPVDPLPPSNDVPIVRPPTPKRSYSDVGEGTESPSPTKLQKLGSDVPAKSAANPQRTTSRTQAVSQEAILARKSLKTWWLATASKRLPKYNRLSIDREMEEQELEQGNLLIRDHRLS